jgi:hypothetical protein
MPHLGLTLHQAMCISYRGRHKVVRLISGIPEHQPLITRTELTVTAINALVDMQGLVIETNLHFTTIGINTRLGGCVSGAAQDIARQSFRFGLHCLEIVRIAGLEFAGDNNELICQQRFTGHARVWISLEKRIEYPVRNAVG